MSNIFASIANTQKIQKTTDLKYYYKILHENIHLISCIFLDYYYVVIKNSILLKQYHKMTIQIPIEGSYFTDISLQIKNFSDKEIKLMMPPNKDLILIFKIKKIFGENLRILKGFKKIENYNAQNLQDYELKPFDVSLLREDEGTKISLNMRLFSRPDFEVINYIKKWGTMNKRVFDDKEIDVIIWFGAFEEGIILLVENYMKEGVYYEKISYKVENLELVRDIKQKRITFNQDSVEIILEGGKYALLKWMKVNNNIEIYSYHFKNQFMVRD